MFEKYFASIRFYKLRRRLQKIRLQFFMATNDFDEEFEKYGLWKNTEPYLEKIMELFPILLSTIQEVEAAESGVQRWDIFDENIYVSITKRDILPVVKTIYETLEKNFAALIQSNEKLQLLKNNNQIDFHLVINSQLTSGYARALQQLSFSIEHLEQYEVSHP